MQTVTCPECNRQVSIEVMRCPCGYPIENLKERHQPVNERDPDVAPSEGTRRPQTPDTPTAE